MAALASLLFFYSHWNGLLRAKEVVIIDTGHHLTSQPMDVVLSESRDLANIYLSWSIADIGSAYRGLADWSEKPVSLGFAKYGPSILFQKFFI